MKLGDEYKLYSHDSCIATTHESPYKKLSIKNCQAIENGYDLDELAMGYDLYENINFVGQMRAFKAGFQKALEILGDKKFSEGDVIKAHYQGFTDVPLYEVIQSLQQTEWGVEIVMNICGDKVYAVPELVLDADGCLILKRK